MPWLRLKWKLNRRAVIKDAYYSVKSIKEIVIRKEQLYCELLKEQRRSNLNQNTIDKLEGHIECLSWLFE